MVFAAQAGRETHPILRFCGDYHARAAFAVFFGTAQAAPAAYSTAEAHALDILQHAIAFRTVVGPGNQTPQVAAYLKDSDDFSHGLNARTPIANLAPARRYRTSMIVNLSQ